MNIKLSIIIPTLDGSIRAKIPEREDVEIVVVKGVSPVGKARNEGLRRAKGEYIAWVDSDDEVEEGWLEEILEVLTQRRRDAESARPEGSSARTGEDLRGTAAPEGAGPDVVTFDAKMVGWKNGRKGLVWGEARPTIEKLTEAVCHDLVRTSALWLYVTRRELWEGVRFNEEVAIIEDFLVLPEILKKAKSVAYIPKILYSYFCNPKSLCHENNAAREREVVRLKAKRGESFSEKRYRQASQLCLAVAHYLVAARVMHQVEGYQTEDWTAEARKSSKWMRKNLPRVLLEVLWHARVSPRERLAWTVRFVTCALGLWGIQKILWRLRHG